MIPATRVLYPVGAVSSTSRVVQVAEHGGRVAVILDVTAAHPVDPSWPDQPSDRGTLRLADGTTRTMVDAVVAATQGDGLLIGDDVPVRTGTEGWTFAVAHVLADGPAEAPEAGDEVVVEVDAAYRRALSAGHTACHLASLALDAALADAWRKETPRDALGAPAFDALAIQESRILEHGSRDVYRIGKSLRRKGFDPSALDDLDGVAARANARLADWVASGAPIRVEAPGSLLADRREWVCELPEGTARIPCGGTHAESLQSFSSIAVDLALAAVDGGAELVMVTTATPR